MKKKVSMSLAGLLMLMIGLALSLVVNLIQFAAANQKTSPVLMGSYSENQTDIHGTHPYLVFDDRGNYCKYSQQEGLLDEGRYVQDAQYQYSLTSASGSTEAVILGRDGVYYISYGGEPSVLFFPRFSETPMFIGEWAAAWPGWHK